VDREKRGGINGDLEMLSLDMVGIRRSVPSRSMIKELPAGTHRRGPHSVSQSRKNTKSGSDGTRSSACGGRVSAKGDRRGDQNEKSGRLKSPDP